MYQLRKDVFILKRANPEGKETHPIQSPDKISEEDEIDELPEISEQMEDAQDGGYDLRYNRRSPFYQHKILKNQGSLSFKNERTQSMALQSSRSFKKAVQSDESEDSESETSYKPTRN
jgi:hypothetical protein